MNNQLNRRIFLKRIGSAGLLSAAGIGIIGCRHNLSGDSSEASDSATSPTSDAGLHEVAMSGAGSQFVFEPDRLIINPGDRVRFVVESSGHTATAYHPDIRSSSPLRIPESAVAWDSGILASAGQVFEHQFNAVGVHNYYCLPHEGSGMVGIVVVGSAGDGPGMESVQDSVPLAARNKLQELIDWARRNA